MSSCYPACVRRIGNEEIQNPFLTALLLGVRFETSHLISYASLQKGKILLSNFSGGVLIAKERYNEFLLIGIVYQHLGRLKYRVLRMLCIIILNRSGGKNM